MPVRMSYQDFFDRCLLINYSKENKIDKFGDPMNCYGLVYWFYKLCLGIELEHDKVASLEDIKSVQYESVAFPKDCDIVFMINLENGQHTGIFIDGCVYHFTREGLRVIKLLKIMSIVRGYFHVNACQNS